MSADLIITASTIITMDDAMPRVTAVAVDTATGKITATGTLAQCEAAAPNATTTDLGDTVLMPGFIEAHSHPMAAGVFDQEPAHWISRMPRVPHVRPDSGAVASLISSLPADQPVICWGLERLTQGAPELSNTDLDEFFPHRPAVILDISGHEAYFNSATIAFNGWAGQKPPADPRLQVWAQCGRNVERAPCAGPVPSCSQHRRCRQRSWHPLQSVARWYQALALAGVTTSSDHSPDGHAEGLRGIGVIAQLPDQGRGLSSQIRSELHRARLGSIA